MSMLSMALELQGVIPEMSLDYSFSCVYRALMDVYRKSMWSFLTFESNWTSPTWVTTGTVTVTQGNSAVVFDAAASTAINAIGTVPSAVTKRQFRIGVGTIYNIWAWDGVHTATLDRNYQEASGSGKGYSIFQAYYPSPVQDFRGWQSIRDMLNFNDLYFNKSRDWVNLRDPQRTFFYIPTHVVPYQNDLNPASATYGWQMFELWGTPTYQLTYQLSGYRSGFVPSSTGTNVPLIGQGCATTAIGNQDSGPPQEIGEDVVMAQARAYMFQWAAARKEYRGMGMMQMKQDTEKDFRRLVSDYRKDDRAKFDAFLVKFRRSGAYPNFEPSYNSISGVASPGAP